MEKTVAYYMGLLPAECERMLGGAHVLLHAGVNEDGDPDDEEQTAGGFQTQAVVKDSRAIEIATGLAMRPFLLVTPVRKREGAPFPERIGVGRTRNADICFPHSKISKYHAYFTEDGDDFFVVDAGSKNGTSVNKVPLDPKVPHRLEDRTIISFARFHVRFHSCAGFLRAIRSLR